MSVDMPLIATSPTRSLAVRKPDDFRNWTQPGPTGMSAFAPLLRANINSTSSDRLGLLDIPVQPASLIWLAAQPT